MVRDGTVSGDMYGERIYHDPVTFSQGVGYPNGEGNVWYVDGTNGSTGGNGKSWTNAWSTIQAAVTAAGPGDTIYITAKDLTDFTGDPTSYTENVVIPAATSNLSIIGISRGRTQGGLPQLKVGATTTQALLTIRAPGCLIANMGFNGIGATGGGILLDDDYATKSAFGTTIANCHFKNCVGPDADDANDGGAIQWSTAGNAWQCLITGCRFYKNVGDICLLGTTNTRPQDIVIEDCDFSGYAAYTDCNICCATDGFGSVKINNCRFGALPAIGANTARYMKLTGTLSGTVSNCTFGCATQGANILTFGTAGTGALIPTLVYVANCTGQCDTEGDTGYIYKV